MFYRECPNLLLRSSRVFLFIILGLFLFACGSTTAKFLARGEEYLAKRKFHDALMQFRSAAESDSGSAKAHWGLARSYENLGQFSEALEELRKTTELDDANLEAKAKLGNYFLLVQPPMISETEKIQTAIVAADPKFVEGHVLKASILAAQSRPESEVVAKVNEAIAIDPLKTRFGPGFGEIGQRGLLLRVVGEVVMGRGSGHRSHKENPNAWIGGRVRNECEAISSMQREAA